MTFAHRSRVEPDHEPFTSTLGSLVHFSSHRSHIIVACYRHCHLHTHLRPNRERPRRANLWIFAGVGGGDNTGTCDTRTLLAGPFGALTCVRIHPEPPRPPGAPRSPTLSNKVQNQKVDRNVDQNEAEMGPQFPWTEMCPKWCPCPWTELVSISVDRNVDRIGAHFRGHIF